MRFRKISSCPRCHGRITARWEHRTEPYASPYWQLIFQCTHCRQRCRLDWDFEPYKGIYYLHAIRRWNLICNGAHQYQHIYQTLKGNK
ncbi:hypothetical protein BBIA_2169 [Bifidobacterium biavatii DSM 23969]|uniref:Transposase n=1 Tax=Bifidobacterium biavatii DSM 23969 TaxID=1437608 RepID=A0A086ZU36_9BIFI|nr:hypothetical protein BBIA_2169 [Bifidobacterium biavatii DSM 23969]